MSESLFKILALCLVATVLCLILKQKSSEYALFIAVAAGVVIAFMLLSCLTAPIKLLKEQLEKYEINSEYFAVALKAVGIGYITTFIADSCRDCGQTSLALKAELAGKCAIFILSLPLIVAVLETAVGFIK